MFNNGFMPNFPYMNYQQTTTDIGQVSSEQEAVNAYVAAGRAKIMFTPDDQTVYVKCVSMNGQTSLDIFDRRPPAAPAPAPEYVTREELTQMLEGLKTANKAGKTGVEE